MDTNDWYALLAPLFLSLLAIEAWIAHLQGKRVFVFADTVSNLACGLGQILLGIFTGAFILGLYDWFGGRFAIMHWPKGSPVAWVLAFLLTDLCYYCFHRGSHRVTLFWAIHEVHHQSEELNLSVALRQTWFSDFTSLFFYWPLPFLGIPREAFFVAVACLSVYQSMQHTRVVRGLGWWGFVFNTPETHGLHHARNAPYRDHNFGSTLVIWDRLFGTFARRTEDPVYGLVEPCESYNPVSAQFTPFVALGRRLARIPRWRHRVVALVMPPEWLAPGETPLVEPPLASTWRGRTTPNRLLAVHAVLQFVAAGMAGLFAIARAETHGLLLSFVAAAWVVWATGNVAGLIEERRWALHSERARLVVLVVGGVLFGRSFALGALAFAVVGVVVLEVATRRPMTVTADA